MIDKATAKDPDDRYQGMKDIVVDLRAARRLLESSGASRARPGSALARPAWLSLQRCGCRQCRHRRLVVTRRADRLRRQRSGKPAIAVLYFENNTATPRSTGCEPASPT